MDGWRPQRSEPQQHQEQFFSIWRTRTRWNRKSHTKEIEFDKPHNEQNLAEHLAVLCEKMPSTSKSFRGLSTSFPINDECTSITATSSGCLVIAGFTDGTIRLFDRTGTFLTTVTPNFTTGSSTSSSSTTSSSAETCISHSSASEEDEVEFDATQDEEFEEGFEEEEEEFEEKEEDEDDRKELHTAKKKKKKKKSATFIEVNSSYHQRYGAVACQIYARGVHTALRLDCVMSDDDQYCFASVLRGNMECVAIHIGPLEALLLQQQQSQPNHPSQRYHNLLDYVHVYRHSDAKLRGLGACTRLQMVPSKTGPTNHHHHPRYLLLTGKSIKNIHIWSFQPPSPSSLSSASSSSSDEPIWQCLYDCPTNGNTIQWLAFRRALDDTNQEPQQRYKLQAISKSLHQKLRVWDISQEELTEGSNIDHDNAEPPVLPQPQQRRNRPPYQDIVNTECALGIAGNWIVCGGELFDNQISIVSLENTLSHHSSSAVYNHTELALPTLTTSATNGSMTGSTSHAASSSSLLSSVAVTTTSDQRRQQRGDMKCVVSVSGIQNHVVLELSDGSVAEYRVTNDEEDHENPSVHPMSNKSIRCSSSGITMIPTIEKLPDSTCTRQLSVRQFLDASSKQTNVVALIAAYQPMVGRGTITIQSLNQSPTPSIITEPSLTMLKTCPKTMEQHDTPIPTKSKTKEIVGDSEHETTKINVVTTVKKPRNQIHSSMLTDSSVRIPGQPALVTTIKKKQSTSKKQKRNDEHHVNVTTPYRIDHSTSIPKKQRTKIALPTSASASSQNNQLKSVEVVDLSSFSTPFPKTIIPMSNDKNSDISHRNANDDNNQSDNYLATIYEKAPTNASAVKQFTPTPLSRNRDSPMDTSVSIDAKENVDNDLQNGTGSIIATVENIGAIAAASIRNSEPSPPIPRKRSVLTESGKQQRRDSLRVTKFSAKTAAVVPSSSRACSDHEIMVLQTVTTKINNNPPASSDSASSNKISIDAPSEVPDCILADNHRPSTPVQFVLPITNVRDRIIALCHDKLRELELYEVQVDVPCISSTVTHGKQYETNPYDKKCRSMVAHHYKSHVQMRHRIVDATRRTIYSIMDAPIVSSLDKAKGFLYSALISYQNLSVCLTSLSMTARYIIFYSNFCVSIYIERNGPTTTSGSVHITCIAKTTFGVVYGSLFTKL